MRYARAMQPKEASVRASARSAGCSLRRGTTAGRCANHLPAVWTSHELRVTDTESLTDTQSDTESVTDTESVEDPDK